jgi:tripartite-type tricarboxylate transporter receptor subunit TctC
MSEQGFADFTAVTWLMMLYPAGTSKEIVNATFKAINAVVANPEVDQKLVSLGLQPRMSNNSEEAANYLRSELKNWGEIVKRSGVERES